MTHQHKLQCNGCLGKYFEDDGQWEDDGNVKRWYCNDCYNAGEPD